MAGSFKRCRRRRYASLRGEAAIAAYTGTGPAHAVYFATYEAVKQAMGGNKGNEHHPLAAGS